MPEKPLLSIIIPVYNAEKFLCSCISSAVHQTLYNRTEVIFIDDGSTDSSGKILDAAAKKYANLNVIHTKNRGVSEARNTGLEKAVGTYVAFTDADDYFESDLFEVLLDEAHNGCDLVCGGYTAEYPGTSVYHKCKKRTVIYGRNIIKSFLQENIMAPIAADKLFLRKKLGNIRFDQGLKIAEDRLFLYQYLKKCRKIAILPLGKYHYRIHSESACRSRSNKNILDSLIVSKRIRTDIESEYPPLREIAECSEIDMKCRVYGELYHSRDIQSIKKHYFRLKKDIGGFSIAKKLRYSSLKHTAAFLAARIYPGFYEFLKNNVRLQYK